MALFLGSWLCATGLVAQTVDIFPTATVQGFPRATEPFTIELQIHNNSAPGSVATGVMVTNTLPAGLTFVSCEVASYVRTGNTFDGTWPQGSSTNYGNVVVCDAGHIPNSSYRPIWITAVATQGGTFNNQVTVKANGTDPSPGNNTLSHPITIHTNGLAVLGGQTIIENSGDNAWFAVELIPASTVTVTVEYSTVDGTAQAGEDYIAKSGTLIFPPGVTNQFVLVGVLDDSVDEEDTQHFSLRLTNAVNAEISTEAESNYVRDDDGPEQLSVSNAPSVLEGDTVTNLVFPITLSAPLDVAVNASYSVGGAVTNSGNVVIPAGATVGSISVPIYGDLAIETNRDVTVSIVSRSPAWVGLGQTSATGTIIEDDGTPGKFDHMQLSVVPSPQIVGRPFSVTFSAFDYFNNPATNYLADDVDLVGYFRLGNAFYVMQNLNLTNFVDGQVTVQMTYTNTTTNGFLVAWKPVGTMHTLFQTPSFKVISSPTLFLSLPTSASEGDGLLAGAGRVTITNIDVQDITIDLTVNDALELQVPASVVIPAGQTSAVFDVTIVDDNRLDGTRPAAVTATSASYITAAGSFSVADNETATLSVALPPSLSEAKGFNTGTGTVYLSVAPAFGMSIYLISSDTTEITVPYGVFLQPNQTSATFTVTAFNDAVMDGSQQATVTAHVDNWTDGSATITVLDDDTGIFIATPTGNTSPIEGIGTITNGLMVQVSGSNTTDIVVTLSSSDTTELIVPAQVVIPAGSLTVFTNLFYPDDNEFDGTQTAIITATAVGLTNGTRTVSVPDNDVHHIDFAAIPTVRTSEVPFSVSFALKDVNDATMTAFRAPIALSAVKSGSPLTMSPVVVTNTAVIRGSWTGNVTIYGWGTNVQLTATATNGIFGVSNAFDLVAPAWAQDLRIGRAQAEESGWRVFFNTVTGKVYTVQGSSTLTNGDWWPVAASIVGTGSETSVVDSINTTNRFYRLSVEP